MVGFCFKIRNRYLLAYFPQHHARWIHGEWTKNVFFAWLLKRYFQSVRLFIHLNDPCVLNRSYMNCSTRGHYTQWDILSGVRHLAIGRCDHWFLFSCCKGIYKYKLIHSSSMDRYAFILSAKILLAQSAGAAEYTTCISAVGVRPPPQQVSWIWH